MIGFLLMNVQTAVSAGAYSIKGKLIGKLTRMILWAYFLMGTSALLFLPIVTVIPLFAPLTATDNDVLQFV